MNPIQSVPEDHTQVPGLAILDKLEARAKDNRGIMNTLVDNAVLPALASNYRRSGIKTHTGMLYRGITQRGAIGNYVTINQNRATAGVLQTGQLFYAKWVLEGRGPVVARRKKALHFFIDGKEFFRKRVGPAPPHPIYFLPNFYQSMAQSALVKFIEGRAS